MRKLEHNRKSSVLASIITVFSEVSFRIALSSCWLKKKIKWKTGRLKLSSYLLLRSTSLVTQFAFVTNQPFKTVPPSLVWLE